MKMLMTKKEVCSCVGYFAAHVDRMAHDEGYRHLGFPKPTYIEGRNGHKSPRWVTSEIENWCLNRIAERDSSYDP